MYNNGGYIAQTQNEQYFNVWDDIEPADTLQTFQKPPGEPACASCRHRQILQTALSWPAHPHACAYACMLPTLLPQQLVGPH